MSDLILIIDGYGNRLCRDGKWRDYAGFGSVSTSVRTYKRLADAKRVARHQTHGVGRVVVIPGDSPVLRNVEAGGKVIEHHPVPDNPGFVTITHAALEDFEVEL